MIISQLELGPPVDHVGGGALNWKAEQADQNCEKLIQSDVKSSQRYITSTAALFCLRTLLTISIQYQADKWWEWRKISIIGSSVDPILNSLNRRNENCMTVSRENYQTDLESARVNNLDINFKTFQVIFIKTVWLWLVTFACRTVKKKRIWNVDSTHLS